MFQLARNGRRFLGRAQSIIPDVCSSVRRGIAKGRRRGRLCVGGVEPGADNRPASVGNVVTRSRPSHIFLNYLEAGCVCYEELKQQSPKTRHRQYESYELVGW